MLTFRILLLFRILSRRLISFYTSQDPSWRWYAVVCTILLEAHPRETESGGRLDQIVGQIIPNPEKNEQINTVIQTTATMTTDDELGSSGTYELPKQFASRLRA